MLIGISGMIGSGKSVLSAKLLKHYKENSLLLNEFEEEDPVFNTMLSWLYERRPNFDVTFQAYVIEHHLGMVEKIKNEFHQKKMNPETDLIFLDRFIAEHYVFASVNLKNASDKIKRAYDAFFNNMVTNEDIPEFAIFLDVSPTEFKKRLFARGRKVEIDSFDDNKLYFDELLAIYKDTFTKVANKYKIEFQIIDTNNLSEEEVFEKAVKLIENYKQSKRG
ncbi:deoxynucleoside kinase [Mycoplasmopsis gallopavonis]|uniref:Deoxyguanosine kinase n=1 Tax=Mycoplasmopsis gallopavonis TaxID=76629 RepID=A0A449AZP5_9BACT|nr:deoxynucleoside kinase [Mycoplasmopsis gallopavonis]RIV16901.1 deoxynucleoside kinase [Mycoplasmopsis gallopavonis]VEU73019.1 Deoxyguanosine kinase [Mycoplasmopsis gallopavonis]